MLIPRKRSNLHNQNFYNFGYEQALDDVALLIAKSVSMDKNELLEAIKEGRDALPFMLLNEDEQKEFYENKGVR